MKEFDPFPYPSLAEDDEEVDRLLLRYFPGGLSGSSRNREDQLLDTLRLFQHDFIIEYPDGV